MELGLVHQTVPEEWSDTIAAFMAAAHPDEDDDDVHNDSMTEPHDEAGTTEDPSPSHSAEGIETAAAEPVPDVTDEDYSHGDEAKMEKTDVDYHYGHHMLTSFQASMSPSAPDVKASAASAISTPTPPAHIHSNVSVLQFFYHLFPSNFSILESHITKLLRPWLHKCRLWGVIFSLS